MNQLQGLFQALTLIGVLPLWGLIEVFLLGFGVTSAIIQIVEDGKDQWTWTAFWVWMTIGLPISAAIIAGALRHTTLSGGEAIFMFVIAIVLFFIGRAAGMKNTRRTMSYTDRDLSVKSEWYMAKVAYPLLFVILGVGWLVDLFADTTIPEKVWPVAWFVVTGAICLMIDQKRDRGVHNPKRKA
jgi:hypothetical protein